PRELHQLRPELAFQPPARRLTCGATRSGENRNLALWFGLSVRGSPPLDPQGIRLASGLPSRTPAMPALTPTGQMRCDQVEIVAARWFPVPTASLLRVRSRADRDRCLHALRWMDKAHTCRPTGVLSGKPFRNSSQPRSDGPASAR